MIEQIPITSREQWLGLRKPFVTASVVGAVFGCHPYVSALRLYIQKQGLVELPEEKDNPVFRRGRILEPAVAEAVREQRPNWTIEKAVEFFCDRDLHLACTPDFFVYGDPRGRGILQTKTAAPSVYARDWQEGQPPLWITLQATTEMMLTEAAFAAVAVLVVDPHELPCHIVEIPRHLAAENKIRHGVRQFWKDIEEGREPGPDYGMDRDLLAAISPQEIKDKKIDLSGDNEVISALIERAELKNKIKASEDRCHEIEALMMDRMRDAATATVPDFRVSWKVEDRKAYSVAAKSTRVLRILDKREKSA